MTIYVCLIGKGPQYCSNENHKNVSVPHNRARLFWTILRRRHAGINTNKLPNAHSPRPAVYLNQKYIHDDILYHVINQGFLLK